MGNLRYFPIQSLPKSSINAFRFNVNFSSTACFRDLLAKNSYPFQHIFSLLCHAYTHNITGAKLARISVKRVTVFGQKISKARGTTKVGVDWFCAWTRIKRKISEKRVTLFGQKISKCQVHDSSRNCFKSTCLPSRLPRLSVLFHSISWCVRYKVFGLGCTAVISE